MTGPSVLISAVALLLGADAPKKTPTDEDKIQGVWVFTSSERGGKAEFDAEKLTLEMEFTAETFRFRLPAGARHPQPFKLDPTKSPKMIDWVSGGKNGPVNSLPGIYELDGDTLKICWRAKGKDRPTEFKTKADADDWLWVLKRAK